MRQIVLCIFLCVGCVFGVGRKEKKRQNISPVSPILVSYHVPLSHMLATAGLRYNKEVLHLSDRQSNDASSMQCSIVRLSKDTRTPEVTAFLAVHGLRPATVRELITFIMQDPPSQFPFPLVALGSERILSIGRMVVYYTSSYEGAIFTYIPLDDIWEADTWSFLGIQKEL